MHNIYFMKMLFMFFVNYNNPVQNATWVIVFINLLLYIYIRYLIAHAHFHFFTFRLPIQWSPKVKTQ